LILRIGCPLGEIVIQCRSYHFEEDGSIRAGSHRINKTNEEGKKYLDKNLLDILNNETIALKTELDIEELKSLIKESFDR